MALRMSMVFNNQGTAGTYTFDINPTQYSHIEQDFTDRQRDVDASLTEFFRGQKSFFTLEFDYVGTAQYANLGTLRRLHNTLTFFPQDENRGTLGSYAVRWVNPFEFVNLGPSWGNGYKGRISLEEI